MNEVTRILSAIEGGDPRAAEQLLPLVYDELRRLAAEKLAREAPGQTLDATALVHEAYLRLVGPDDARRWKDRGHFFAAAAQAMRRILVDNARRKRARKRGAGLAAAAARCRWLRRKSSSRSWPSTRHCKSWPRPSPIKARLVELRYFAGLTGEQAAKVLDISPATADRHWAYARAWLRERGSRPVISWLQEHFLKIT